MDVTEVTAAVEAGELDGHLDDIALAVVERARTGAVAFYWRLTVDGDEWTQESVTLGELKFAEQHAKVTDQNGRTRRATAAEIDPRSSAEHLVALLVARFFKVDELPLTERSRRPRATRSRRWPRWSASTRSPVPQKTTRPRQRRRPRSPLHSRLRVGPGGHARSGRGRRAAGRCSRLRRQGLPTLRRAGGDPCPGVVVGRDIPDHPQGSDDPDQITARRSSASCPARFACPRP